LPALNTDSSLLFVLRPIESFLELSKLGLPSELFELFLIDFFKLDAPLTLPISFGNLELRAFVLLGWLLTNFL